MPTPLQNLQNGNDPPAINVIAFVKNEHRFAFLYDDDSDEQLLQQLGHFAGDRELPDFTWYDAAVLSQRVRRDRKRKQEDDRQQERDGR